VVIHTKQRNKASREFLTLQIDDLLITLCSCCKQPSGVIGQGRLASLHVRVELPLPTQEQLVRFIMILRIGLALGLL
jgi:hypothetical protein